MKCALWAVLLVALICAPALSQTASRDSHSSQAKTATKTEQPQIDLGWLRAGQQEEGWLVESANQLPRNGNAILAGDLVLSVDGHRLAAYNPLTAARLLNQVTLDAKNATVVRDGRTVTLTFVFFDPLLSNSYYMSSDRRGRMYKRGEHLPDFALPDIWGQTTKVKLPGQWTLLRIGIDGEGAGDAKAFDEVAKTQEVQAVAVEEHDPLVEARRFMLENHFTFRALVAESKRIGDPDESEFANKVLPAAGCNTHILIDPSGQVVFVSAGDEALKSAWAAYKRLKAD